MNKFFLFIALFAILISCSKEEIKESTKNLNTRLSNLKKINKSLDTIEKDNTSLN